MIRMEYPTVNLDNYSGDAKVYALQSQVNSLANALQIVLDSLEDDGNGFTQDIDEVSGKTSEVSEKLSEVTNALSNHTVFDSGELTAVSVESSTALTNLANVTLTKGTYILVGRAIFEKNANGRRGLAWGSQEFTYFGVALVVEAPASDGTTLLQTVLTINITDDTYQMRLNGYHTAGTRLNVTPRYRILKLGQGE